MTHKHHKRPFRGTTVNATPMPPSSVQGGKRKKLPPSVVQQFEEIECAGEWYEQWSNPGSTSGLDLSIVKGSDKVQLCRSCKLPYKQNRLKYGIPASTPFATPEFYCPTCFKEFNCREA